MAAEVNKPDFSFQWASGGGIVAPSDTKIQEGWTAEVPPFQWENFLQNRQDNAILHLFQKGISVWDSLSNYYFTSNSVRSYVQGSDGKIYVAVQNSIGQNPVTDTSNVYWKIAFSSTDIATTTTAGVVQLATSAQMLTGTSTSLVPPVSAISAQLPFRGIQTYSTAGTVTWTVPSGVTKAWVYVSGGGGGGGGATSSTGAAGGGGGGGATGLKLLSLVGVTSVSVTVGAGGAGGIGNNTGVNGSTTSFGSFITANGGAGGAPSNGSSTFSGAGGTTVTGGDVTVPGGAGKFSLVNSGSLASAGPGGDSYFGKGYGAPNVTGTAVTSLAGFAGLLGAGGSGAAVYNATATGGAGGAGYVLILY